VGVGLSDCALEGEPVAGGHSALPAGGGTVGLITGGSGTIVVCEEWPVSILRVTLRLGMGLGVWAPRARGGCFSWGEQHDTEG